MDKKVAVLLLLHEGYREKVYRCSGGRWTLGIGRNVQDKGISFPEAIFLLQNDILECKTLLQEKYSWFKELSENRQIVLVDMCFNLGITRLSKFKQTLAAIERGEYLLASQLMLDSKWARQVGERAKRLSTMMRTNAWPEDAKQVT